jgi:ATP-dependent Clp protease ATP-binding subunit ClpA
MFERFTDRARRVIVLAQEEARMLGHNYIGTEHILLALLREGDGVAAQVLVGAGVDVNQARQQIINLLHRGREEDAPSPPVSVPPLAVSTPPPGADLESRLASFAARLNAIELLLRESDGA